MRVVHINYVHDHEGRSPDELLHAWPTLGAVATAVHRAGAEVVVLQASRRSAAIERDGVRYLFVAEPCPRGRRSGFFPWRLSRAAATLKPDVIHVNGLDFPFHTRALCRLGAPVLVQDHASVSTGRTALRRWGIARAAAVAFTAVDQAEPFRASGILSPDMPVVAVPESSTTFSPAPLEGARSEAGVHGDPMVLWVGRLDDNKDPLTILRAIELAMPHLPDLQLWCCFHEEGLLPAIRERLAAAPHLAARVHLLGKVPHARIQTLCRAADFFMLGSHRESAGYALLEALACGATPIVSDIPSFRVLTGDGAIGALAPMGNPTAFADALIRLAREPRAALRARAIAHFTRNLSFDVVGARLLALYAQLAAGHAPR
ncbi:MAG: hypothetical protein JWN66_1041 [Sphingomonas bacterium]|uniref:glycosyltransferase family 4 protein n=1 Tax=Sphingomonas bacterium TaxID=1895847 RepID=UPI002612E82C|nr:glycosyltransferase family 4 protein [Sphingomonas bacterium]MDB5703925.1 hypothetical protein [Sphingomonas bacterium]